MCQHFTCTIVFNPPNRNIIPSWQISKLRQNRLNYLSKIKDLVEWWHSKPSFPDSRIYGLYLLECSVSGDEHRVEWRPSPSSTGREVVITSLLPFLLLSLSLLPLFLLLSLFVIKSTTWQGQTWIRRQRKRQTTQEENDSSHQIYDLCDLEQIPWLSHGLFPSSSSEILQVCKMKSGTCACSVTWVLSQSLRPHIL